MFCMMAPTFVSEEREVNEFHGDNLANDDDVDVDLTISRLPLSSSEFRKARIIIG